MNGIKIETLIHGETVELDPPDEDGDVRMIVTEINSLDEIRTAEVYLTRENRRYFAHALLAFEKE